MNPPSSPSPHLWAERYETLRRHFLEDRQLLASDPLGLTLLLRSGVAAWMRRWIAGTGPIPETETISKPARAAPEAWRPPALAGPEPLTRLLAHITLQHLQPARK